MTSQEPKIFLSYAHEDIGMAKRLYQDLKRYGLDIWFDNESLLPGQNWENEIRKAIRESDYFIALLSDKCLSKRGFVHSELKFSFEIVKKYFPTDKGIFIIPVRLDECKPSDAYKRLGRLHWIDVFPESKYQNGLKKILQVVSPGTFLLRSKPIELSAVEVIEMIVRHGFFDRDKNPGGKGFSHKYKLQEVNGDEVVFDEISCLMWQQSGSLRTMIYEEAKMYIDELNERQFAGFNDWRLPTLEEAMSLMESEHTYNRYINPIFDSNQYWIWTADQLQGSAAQWVIYFNLGYCSFSALYASASSVRAVRSGKSSKE